MTTGLTDVCLRTEYVVCVPYDTSITSGPAADSLMAHKPLLLAAWFVVAMTFAAARRAFGDRTAADWLLVDSIARSLSVGVATDRRQQAAASGAVVRGVLNVFAMLLATFVSGALFEEFLQPVGDRRAVHTLAELVATTRLPVRALDFYGARQLLRM